MCVGVLCMRRCLFGRDGKACSCVRTYVVLVAGTVPGFRGSRDRIRVLWRRRMTSQRAHC